MTNKYLHIEKNHWSWSDGVFSGFSTMTRERVVDFCLEQAEDMRHSDLANYDCLNKEQREELARRWEAAKDFLDGEYDYYFNLENKTEVFKKSVKELAERLGIKYQLKLK